jgi:polyphenol oxidase
MLSLSKFFDNPSLVAFTSDATIDFTLNEAAPFLTEDQKAYLSIQTGSTIHSLAWAKQTHGSEIVIADERFNSAPLQEADAIMTDKPNIPIAVRTADCLPIFIFDPTHQAIAVVHAGWKGTQKEIFKETYLTMQAKYKTDYEDLLIAFGPAIRSCCYEVGQEFAGHFPNAVVLRDGKLYMDVIKANRDQLYSLGIERDQFFDCRICTSCDKSYFSYRRDGDKAGRMVSVMMLKKI